jgi:hypothetical protein
MPSPRFIPVLALAMALGSPAADARADGGQTVHRCAGRHGEIVFSGLPCISGEGTAPSVEPELAARSCPQSSEELRDRVVAAIARRDPNMLAGMLRWGGVGGEAAGSRLRSLRKLATRPLLAIEHAEAGLRVRTGSGDHGGVQEHRFGVSIAAGCHWLTW